MFKFADNIIRFRKDKGVTQEQLADFLGVTKASVSKWETKQSMPDISLLPIIASYFDVSIDELLGYEPKLLVEEIEKIYGDLSKEYATQPFEEVMSKSEALVKQYFNCYPFLLQIAVLWLNHYMLASSKERQDEILQKASELCEIVMDKEKLPEGTLASKRIISESLKKKCYNMKNEPDPTGNSITIEYEEGYHLDFALYGKKGDVYYHCGANEWEERNPKAISRWFNNKNQENNSENQENNHSENDFSNQFFE